MTTLKDDATGLDYLRFFPTDSTETNMTLMRDYIATYGRPGVFSGDIASHFQVNWPTSVEEDLAELAPQTQI